MTQPARAGMRRVADVMAAECAGAIVYTTSMPRVNADVLEGADNRA